MVCAARDGPVVEMSVAAVSPSAGVDASSKYSYRRSRASCAAGSGSSVTTRQAPLAWLTGVISNYRIRSLPDRSGPVSDGSKQRYRPMRCRD
ncbi:MAG: hypothetical protein J07HR59_00203 [Halorubrum sp. J07HR59]|nr:MAG: hypothetical protein J07HR59_00203 [Halorubrum sp. J07HR59]